VNKKSATSEWIFVYDIHFIYSNEISKLIALFTVATSNQTTKGHHLICVGNWKDEIDEMLV